MNPLPHPLTRGYKFDMKEFTIGDGLATVVEAATSKQLTEMETGTHYIISEVLWYSDGTPTYNAYLHLNTAATDEAATRFGETDYHVLSAIVFEGFGNGKLNADLTAKPYLYASAGTGSVAQKMRGIVKYYYK